MQFLSLYLHVPFCQTRCTYCAFNTYTDKFALVEPYVNALCDELRQLAQGQVVHTVYFGGGTPSLLSPNLINQILCVVRQEFDVIPKCEITLEANPGTIRRDYWDALRSAGVNRISLGMQSAHAGELMLYGRDHQFEDVALAVKNAREEGFDNLSLDLIYGTPRQTLRDWEESLNHALSLSPQHLSLYALSLESGTELTRRIRGGHLPMPDDDLAADMYDLACQKLAGFEHYEISNWAVPDKQAHHNIQYWRNRPYLGLGAGAHGYTAGFRTVNVMRPEQYIRRLTEQGESLEYPRTGATQSLEMLTHEQEIFETMMMGLRLLQEGVSRTEFEARFGESLDERYRRPIRRLKDRGLLVENDDRLYLTEAARFVSNRVFEAFVL